MTIKNNRLDEIKKESIKKAEKFYHLQVRKFINLSNEKSQKIFDSLFIDKLSLMGYHTYNLGYTDAETHFYFRTVKFRNKIKKLLKLIKILISLACIVISLIAYYIYRFGV